MNADLDTYDPGLDERLHQELAHAPLQLLDPAAVTAAGGRALRRQRLARGSGALAAVLAIGIGGYAVSDAFDRGATPAPPASSSTTSEPPTVQARLEPFSALRDGETVVEPGRYARFDVTWQPSTKVVGFSAFDGKGTQTMAGQFMSSALDAPGVAWQTMGPDSHVIVGIMPAAAREFSVVAPNDPAGGQLATQQVKGLDGTPWQAFAVFFAEPKYAAAVTDILWIDASGAVHDSRGASVPAVRLGTDADAPTVYMSESANVLGIFDHGQNGQVPLTDGSSPSVIAFGAGSGTEMNGIFAMLVPAGSTKPTVTPNAGVTATPARIEALPGSDVAVLWAQTSRTTDEATADFATVSWTDPSGERTTITNY